MNIIISVIREISEHNLSRGIAFSEIEKLPLLLQKFILKIICLYLKFNCLYLEFKNVLLDAYCRFWICCCFWARAFYWFAFHGKILLREDDDGL